MPRLSIPTLALLTQIAAPAIATTAVPGHQIARIQRGETQLQADQPRVRFLFEGDRVERIYGAALTFGESARSAAQSFVTQYAADIYGVAPESLVLHGMQDVMLGKFTAVYFTQHHQGTPVNGAGLTVLVRHDIGDGVVLVSGPIYPIAANDLDPVVIDGAAAVEIAAAAHPNFKSFDAPRLVVFVGDADQDGIDEARYGYRFGGRTGGLIEPEGYQMVVDATAANAGVVWREPEIYNENISGVVTANATPGWIPDRPGNSPVVTPVDQIRVRVAAGNVSLTDATGAFTIEHPGSDPVQVSTTVAGLNDAGPWVRVVNNGTGGIVSASATVTPPGPANLLLNPTPSEFLTAQVNAFIHTTRVHDFAKAINPNHPGLDIQMPANVNIAFNCNATYDRNGPSINFYRAGGGCPNMAYTSVIYHEYGHHIVNEPYDFASRAQPSSTYHEGNADITAFLLMDDPCMGYGFFGGNTCLRSGVNNQQYPCSGGGHDCGRMISGSFWDTRVILGSVDPGNALDIIRSLWMNSILLLPTTVTPAITVDVLTLDDTDDDITNGTPHYFQIAQGFGNHNLDAPPLTAIELSLPDGVPTQIRPSGGTRIRILATPVASQADPANSFLYLAVGGGEFTQIPLESVSTAELAAVFPPVACRESVRFYLSIATVGGPVFRLPSTPANAVYTAVSTYWTEQGFADDFQSDLGWSVNDSDTLGFGSWGLGTANGNPAFGTPSTDYDGSGRCYLTGPASGRNVDSGSTALISPPMTFAGDAASLRYAAWFSNATGTNPGQDVMTVEYSRDDGQTWTLLETYGPTGPTAEPGWHLRVWELASIAAPGDVLRLRFTASDVGGPSVVEGAVDAVSLVDHRCEPNDIAGDMNCDGLLNFFDIDGFVLALFDPAAYVAANETCRLENADVNADGAINFFDVDPFIALIFP